jgi:hypothetical protein
MESSQLYSSSFRGKSGRLLWTWQCIFHTHILANFSINCMWSVQKVSDLNFSRIKQSSTGSVHHCTCGGRGGVRCMQGLGPTMTTRGLGLTMTARGQSISISIGMLPQTLDQLSRLGAQF